MNLINRIRVRLTEDLMRSLYRRNVSQVLATPPLKPGKLPFITLSMVQKRDVLSYLVAIKSFARFADSERVVVVCDPSIGEEESAIFRAHIPHIELRQATEFIDPRIPRGGCWERLSAITTYSPESYVVQLDGDTVTVGAIEEVVDGVTRQQGFVLGERRDQQILTLNEESNRAKQSTSPHIQALSEQVIAEVGLNGKFYVRGCAGFTGFPPDTQMRDKFFDFSERMAERLGNRWPEWGTEQVTSNYLVANSTAATLLPFPKYSTPRKVNGIGVFQHYIGTIRFRSRTYERISLSVIADLVKGN